MSRKNGAGGNRIARHVLWFNVEHIGDGKVVDDAALCASSGWAPDLFSFYIAYQSALAAHVRPRIPHTHDVVELLSQTVDLRMIWAYL